MSKVDNFIRKIIDKDLIDRNIKTVYTRFPPEPNGYLHIGHAKAIFLNFGVANSYKEGKCNLRFDDTNPEKEDDEYIKSIREDIKWLGFDWGKLEFFASDYFEKFYNFAEQLILSGKAYVDSLDANDIRKYRGTLIEGGIESPYRNRTVEENLELFKQMRAGKFAEGECLLRAKIDMSSPNINMRDPAIYRIKKISHHRTGNSWCIYPMYDYAHCLSDGIEGITHSLCTLEFEDHRPLYNWFLEQLSFENRPKQIEFARLNINYTITSKRKLNELVQGKHVTGWDDPRMPTIIGMRRRGYTPSALRDFCERIGITKNDTVIDMGVLENCIREDLNKKAKRVMAVLDPLKVVIENYPEDESEKLMAFNHPADSSMGTREVSFSKVIYIERSDFMEDAPKKFFRLSVGKEVRLRYAYFILCRDIIKNDKGDIIELRCTYDPKTKGGKAADGRKVKGTIHWVCAKDAISAEVRMYDRLFSDPKPENKKPEESWDNFLNLKSVVSIKNCYLEKSLASAKKEEKFQFERIGYFCVDNKDSLDGAPIFNQTVTLRDSWAKKKGS